MAAYLCIVFKGGFGNNKDASTNLAMTTSWHCCRGDFSEGQLTIYKLEEGIGVTEGAGGIKIISIITVTH